MSKSSTSVNRKALKLDNKVKAINHCDVGKSCRAVGEEILKENVRFLTILKTMLPVQRRCYWKLYFCLLNIFIYLFVCFIQIISY